MIVFDAHCDAPSQMSRLRDYRLDNPHAQVDFPKMPAPVYDPIFDAPYEPTESSAKPDVDRNQLVRTQTQGKKKGMVAVLLGGLMRK